MAREGPPTLAVIATHRDGRWSRELARDGQPVRDAWRELQAAGVSDEGGPEHVVVVGGQGDVYAWGRGHKGRLGLGHEEDCCSPQEVTSLNTEEIYIVNVCCSGAGTMLLTDSGTMYACGENNDNR